MAHDTADSAAKVPRRVGDLGDVDDATPVAGSTLVYSATDTQFNVVNPATTIAAVAAANATDDTTVWALANELKTKFDLLLAAAKTHGIVASS